MESCKILTFLPKQNTAAAYRADGCYHNLFDSDTCRGNTAVTLKTHTHTHTHTYSTYITVSSLTLVLNVISSEGCSFLAVKLAEAHTCTHTHTHIYAQLLTASLCVYVKKLT